MKIRNQQLIDENILQFIKRSRIYILRQYNEYGYIEKFVRPPITSSRIAETVMRMSIKTKEGFNKENGYFISDTLYELACIDLEQKYLKNAINNYQTLKRIDVSKRMIDDTFKENLIKVQGNKSDFFYAIARTSNWTATKVETIKINNDDLLFDKPYKYYAFSSNSNIPSVFLN